MRSVHVNPPGGRGRKDKRCRRGCPETREEGGGGGGGVGGGGGLWGGEALKIPIASHYRLQHRVGPWSRPRGGGARWEAHLLAYISPAACPHCATRHSFRWKGRFTLGALTHAPPRLTTTGLSPPLTPPLPLSSPPPSGPGPARLSAYLTWRRHRMAASHGSRVPPPPAAPPGGRGARAD